MTAPGVEGAAAPVLLAPGDRMVAAHRAAGVRGLVEGGQDVHPFPGIGAVVVPLVRTLPGSRKSRGRRVSGVLDVDRRGLDRGMRLEVGAHETAVEGPVVLGVGGRVDARVTTSPLDVPLERALLGVVEDVTGGREEHHGVVPREVACGEGARVLGGVDRETALGPQLPYGRDPFGNRVVSEARCLREHQHPAPAGTGRALRRGRSRHTSEEQGGSGTRGQYSCRCAHDRRSSCQPVVKVKSSTS